jgi:DNA-binding LytR/AlgR family response regulator
MILTMGQRRSQKDIEVTVTYPEMNSTVKRIASFLKTVDVKIPCDDDGDTKLIPVHDIYYIESVDKLSVVCCEKENYQSNYRLYQLHDKLEGKGFVQVSKYCIVNIHKLEKIKPLYNSRMEAMLTNGARVYVSRKYLAAIKKALQ